MTQYQCSLKHMSGRCRIITAFGVCSELVDKESSVFMIIPFSPLDGSYRTRCRLFQIPHFPMLDRPREPKNPPSHLQYTGGLSVLIINSIE